MFRNTIAITAILLLTFGFAFAAGLKQVWTDGSGKYRNGLRLHGVVASADGTKLYTLDDKNLRVWNSDTGEGTECVTLNFPGEGPFISTDGKLLIYVEHRELKFIDLVTAQVVFTRRFERDDPSYAWSDGKRSIVGTKAGEVWAGEIGKPDSWALAVEEKLGTFINCIAVGDDGKAAFVADQQIAVFDKDFKKLWGNDQKGNGLYSCHFISARGKQLLVGVGFRKILAWNSTTGSADTAFDSLQGVTAACTDGSRTYLAYLDNRIAVFDLADGPMERTEWKTLTPQYNLLALPGNKIVGFDLNGDWYVWDTGGRVIAQPVESRGQVVSAAWGKGSGDGWIAVSRTRGISVYTAKDGKELPRVEEYDKAAMLLKGLSDGRMVAIYYDRRVALFDVYKGRKDDEFAVSVLPVDVVIGANGFPLYLGADRLVHSVTARAEDGKPLQEAVLPMPKARFWKFAPSGDAVILENPRHQIGIMRLTDGETSYIGGHQKDADSTWALLDASVHGDAVATIANTSLIIWSISGKSALSTEIKLPAVPARVAMLDENRAAVAYPNGNIEVYGRSGSMLSEWKAPTPITALCGSANGLVAGMVDSTVTHFDVE